MSLNFNAFLYESTAENVEKVRFLKTRSYPNPSKKKNSPHLFPIENKKNGRKNDRQIVRSILFGRKNIRGFINELHHSTGCHLCVAPTLRL